jgi:hypothetical protein
MNGVFTRKIPLSAVPTVDIKAGSNIIERIVNKTDIELRAAHKRVRETNKTFNSLMKEAEKKGVRTSSKYGVGEKIFRKLSGEDVQLTKAETASVDYLKNYFAGAKKDLDLKKYRRNYITNIEKTFLEKLKANNWNLLDTVKKYRTKEGDIPIDVFLALDEIIGSKKFFKFALERKGGTDPTMNMRKILKEYSSLAETKVALDKILPEGQAAVQLLLQKNTAQWMQKWLQNLKGRGPDFRGRQGRAKWAYKVGDRIIDFGYIRLLATNYGSAIKNIIGGEVNSFVYQTFDKYLTGKKRFLLNPKRAYKMIADTGMMDGSYIDIIRPDFITKSKQATDIAFYGLMKGAEYEIRGSYFLGELTAKEWKAGELSPERFREILDGIAITQGVYTKVDSPLFVQTVPGRAIMQFSRWKITNLALARRLGKGARKEWRAGNYTGKNTRSLLKMATMFGIGQYLVMEATKAGYKEAAKYAEASTELVNVFTNIPGEVMRAITENPALQTLDSILYTFQASQHYMGLGPAPRKIKFRRGAEDMYFAVEKLFKE